MPRFDATINGKSLASYGITPTTATVPQPDAKTYQADIPGRDGMLDYTDAFGVIRYDNRTVTVEAYEIGDIATRIDHRRAICSDMHGKSCKLSLSTLEGYTFNGRCSVEYEEDGSQTVYTLSFDCDPYMSAGERTFYANCAGGADLVFISGDKPVKPRIEVPRRSIVVFEGNRYDVDEGTWTFDGIVFKRGRNELYVNTYTEPGTTTWGDLQSMTWDQIAWHHQTATASGDILNIDNALKARAGSLTIPGKSVQDGTPTPDTPVPIVNVTSPVQIRNDDFVFYIKHAGGLFDWSITNADNLTWYFPDGTTSTEARLSRTIDAGTVKVVCDDWTKVSIEINDNGTDSAFVGDISDLPPVTSYLNVNNCSNLTGDISDLPPVTYYLNLYNCRLTGNIADLPPVTYHLSLYNCRNLTGNIADLPRVTYNLNLASCPLLTGNIADLPPVTYYLNLYNCRNLTGNIADLPPVTYYLNLYNCRNLTGNIADLPPVTYYLNLYNCRNLTGNIADLPPVTYYLSLYNCSNLTGDISDLPPVTNYLDLYNCSNLTGNISDLPPVTNYLDLYNCSNLTGNISDLPPVTNYLSVGNCQNLTGVLSVTETVKEIYLQGTGMSASDTDQTLINLAATTTVTSGGILRIKKNRTSASDAAFAYLSSRFTITEV